MSALIDKGQTVHVHGEATAPRVKAITKQDLHSEFNKRYISDHDDPMKRAEAVRKAINRSIEKATASGEYAAGNWGGFDWVWRLKPD
jgi:hypothetical protein